MIASPLYLTLSRPLNSAGMLLPVDMVSNSVLTGIAPRWLHIDSTIAEVVAKIITRLDIVTVDQVLLGAEVLDSVRRWI